MAVRNVIESDLDGSTDAKRYRFSIEGESYVVDLTPEQYQSHIVSALAPVVKVALPGTHMRRRAGVPVMTKGEREEVREWGRAQGFYVPRFGRIPKKVLIAFVAAHPGKGIDLSGME